VLAGAFLISGASALAFETLWFHQARLAFGQSVWASSLVLSAFMLGMALGNWLCARHGQRAKSALGLYAGIELLVAILGVSLVYLLPGLGRAFAPLAEPLAAHPALLNLLRLAGALVLLVVPAAAMGMTLPLLAQAAGRWDANFGRVLGLLYGANTLGAVLGVLLTETVLLERFGIRGSALCAGMLNLGAAGGVLALARFSKPLVTSEPSAAPERSCLGASASWLVAGFLAGFLLLALEVVWLRFLYLFLSDTPLAFAVVLALVLSGLAGGSLSASLGASRSARAARGAWWVAYLAGLLGLAGYLLYPRLLQGALAPYPDAWSIAAIAAPLVLPTSLASGALFTLVGAGLREVAASDAAAAGRLGCVNTLGAGLGPLIAGFVLLPRLGMERSLLLLFALYGLIGALLSWRIDVRPRWRYASAPLFAAAFALFPFGAMQSEYIRVSASRWAPADDAQIHVREGLTATILHIRHHAHGVPLVDQIATNAYSMSVNGYFGRRYMKLFVYLPLALHPRVKRALVVGYGIGNTAEALVDSGELERIDVVDISRDMLEESRRIPRQRGRQPLDDPRLHVHIEDGRFFLQSASARYDLITGEPPPPIIAGVVDLYTTEYFQLMRDRLRDGGIASYWLPVMNLSLAATQSLIRGFCAAFADCSLWHGAARNFMLLGTRNARGPVSEQRFRQQWDNPRVRPELSTLGFELPAQLGALFIGDAPYLRALTADVEALSDDRPGLIQSRGPSEDLDARVLQWRQARDARERFQNSRFIAEFWPERQRQESLSQFGVQQTLNDLLFPEPTDVRHARVLHNLLFATRLRLPVLLLVGSDPDRQRALAGLSPAQREQPEWLLHRAAASLADRDLRAALDVLERVPQERLSPPDLRDYLAYAVRRTSQIAAP
jgi:spermidine synthase